MYFKMAPLYFFRCWDVGIAQPSRLHWEQKCLFICWLWGSLRVQKTNLSIVLVQWYDPCSLRFSSMLSVVQSCRRSCTWLCFDELCFSLSPHLRPGVGSDRWSCVLTSLIGLGKADYISVSFILSFSFFFCYCCFDLVLLDIDKK